MLVAMAASAASFRVQAPSQVAAGGVFRVEFVLDGADGSSLSLPDFEGMQLLYGPEVSTSMSMSSINGSMSSRTISTSCCKGGTKVEHDVPPEKWLCFGV